jgi:hypothetical protein
MTIKSIPQTAPKPSTPTNEAPPTSTDPKVSAEPSTGEVTTNAASAAHEETKPIPAAEERVAITVMFPGKLASKVRLYSSITGQTITAVVLDSVSRDVPPKLKTALAAIEDDLA